jgi:hypothetical protein
MNGVRAAAQLADQSRALNSRADQAPQLCEWYGRQGAGLFAYGSSR